MDKSVMGVPTQNVRIPSMNISEALVTIDSQQEAIKNIIAFFEHVLYGIEQNGKTPQEASMGGIEARLNEIVINNEQLVSRLNNMKERLL